MPENLRLRITLSGTVRLQDLAYASCPRGQRPIKRNTAKVVGPGGFLSGGTKAGQDRARWPTHELWRAVEHMIASDLHESIAGVLPRDVKEANRQEHMRMLDRQILGLFVSRAAASGVEADAFAEFMDNHVSALQRASDEHPVDLDAPMAKGVARYRWT